eukprot:11661204-Karenia_brevis.AAC.1
MSKGKSSDRSGIVVEMLQCGGDLLMQYLADLFTAILEANGSKPSSWSDTFITVLFKKGDPQLPGNYRPISILPILYK